MVSGGFDISQETSSSIDTMVAPRQVATLRNFLGVAR